MGRTVPECESSVSQFSVLLWLEHFLLTCNCIFHCQLQGHLPGRQDGRIHMLIYFSTILLQIYDLRLMYILGSFYLWIFLRRKRNKMERNVLECESSVSQFTVLLWLKHFPLTCNCIFHCQLQGLLPERPHGRIYMLIYFPSIF